MPLRTIAPTSVYLSISGMSCASCVSSIEQALSNTPGVTSASVNYADQSASVRFAGSPEQLVAAVKQLGFDATWHEAGADESGLSAIEYDIEVQEERLARELRASLSKAGIALMMGIVLLLNEHVLRFLPMPSSAAEMSVETSVETGSMAALFINNFWLLFGLLLLGIMWFSGGHFFRGAWSAAKHAKATMDTLIAMGTGAAWVYSMLVIALPGLFPELSRHYYFDAAVLIIGFINLGKALESHARGKTSLAIKKLLTIAPKTALRIEGDIETEIAIAEVLMGEHLRIHPGETIPVDGSVIDGASSVDESMLTGESIPLDKSAGDALVAGTINQYGTLVMRADKIGRDTLLARMVRLVREAQNSKPRIAHLVDQIASVFVPVVLLVAIITALSWWLLGPEPRLSHALITSMSVLIIACPCALGLAIPMSIMVGMGRAASEGILIRKGEALQAAKRITTLIVDKTGTLTEGKPEVTQVHVTSEHVASEHVASEHVASEHVALDERSDKPADKQSKEQEMLGLAYGLEKLSEHPLARAVVTYCEAQESTAAEVVNFSIIPGMGVRGDLLLQQGLAAPSKEPQEEQQAEPQLERVAAGSLACLEALGMTCPPGLQADTAGSLIYVGRGTRVLGFVELFDAPRASAAAVITRLHNMKVRLVMLSGDREQPAARVARELGIDEYHAGMPPEAKLAFVQQLQQGGDCVGMVGDGINDALALSAADVSFAMGGGTDVAIDSADIALLSDDLSGIIRAILLSRRILRNIYQNLTGAFAYNIILIPVAAGLLFPITGLLIDPIYAGLAMAASSVTVVTNASRLKFLSIAA